MTSLVCEAIRRRVLTTFFYDGGPRMVEPYCHGMSSTGKGLVRAYQVEGFSRSGQPVGWKLFETMKMVDVHLTDDHFPGDRPDFNPDDPHMRVVHCRV